MTWAISSLYREIDNYFDCESFKLSIWPNEILTVTACQHFFMRKKNTIIQTFTRNWCSIWSFLQNRFCTLINRTMNIILIWFFLASKDLLKIVIVISECHISRMYTFLGAKPSLETTYFTESVIAKKFPYLYFYLYSLFIFLEKLRPFYLVSKFFYSFQFLGAKPSLETTYFTDSFTAKKFPY